MSIKSIIKRCCPDYLLPVLRVPYRIAAWPYRTVKNRMIVHRAEKYLPYYQDDLSREILKAREEYLMNYDESVFFRLAEKEGLGKYQLVTYSSPDEREYSGIVILYDEESSELERHKIMLSECGWKDRFRLLKFQDYVNGSKISDDELAVALLNERNKFHLLQMTKNALSNFRYGRLISIREEDQYLDVFAPAEDEIIVDAGAYDGDTALRFLKWGGSKIKHIYSLEFDPVNAVKCEENLRPYADKITIVKKGTWDKDEIIYISADGRTDSRVDKKGNTRAELTAIDSIVNDEAVTFIKMDVEGAELKSLIGAKNIIIKNRPRLAICVYHKPEDIYEIPGYILSLVPEYKFYLRHYSTHRPETVLYAYCE